MPLHFPGRLCDAPGNRNESETVTHEAYRRGGTSPNSSVTSEAAFIRVISAQLNCQGSAHRATRWGSTLRLRRVLSIPVDTDRLFCNPSCTFLLIGAGCKRYCEAGRGSLRRLYRRRPAVGASNQPRLVSVKKACASRAGKMERQRRRVLLEYRCNCIRSLKAELVPHRARCQLCGRARRSILTHRSCKVAQGGACSAQRMAPALRPR